MIKTFHSLICCFFPNSLFIHHIDPIFSFICANTTPQNLHLKAKSTHFACGPGQQGLETDVSHVS